MKRAAKKRAIRPRTLSKGDTVGIVAPASCMNREAFVQGCEALRELGYKPFYFDSIFARDIYFAGSAEQRARDLEAMFENDDVAAILCARGGYGANYLLELLDIEKILAHPKPFVGYSDVTTLLTWFTDHGLVTFHGPMVAPDFSRSDGIDVKAWRSVLGGESFERKFTRRAGVHAMVEGECEGTLYGGCLSMLTASLGTPYEVHTEGSILFIEDLAAKPYQVDRMLMQLKLAGKFEGVRGIIFGEMLECVQPGSHDYTLEGVVARVVGDLGIPVAYGVRSGHVTSGNVVLPIGVKTRMSARKNGVTLQTEPATRK
ncbi:MAG TPA: LD-carboxypeptidase [Gemmatimonadaceae bacterium]|nr:LD-carboxypeptidase [Gemmatimonadaceae bacterium]